MCMCVAIVGHTLLTTEARVRDGDQCTQLYVHMFELKLQVHVA